MSTAQKQIRDRTNYMMQAAYSKYANRFDNGLYTRATYRVGNNRANRLIDEALALCGHPSYNITYTEWNEAELAFLVKFTK